MANRRGKSEAVTDFIFLGSRITVDGDSSHEIQRHLLLGRKVVTNLDIILKNRHYFANQGPYGQSFGFSSNHVWMWELNHKGDWMPKNWCFWTVVLEKTLESSLDYKEIKLVNTNTNNSWSSSSLATWCKELTHWKRPWCWERLKAKGEEGDRGQDSQIASPTQMTWIWANSKR